MEKSIKAITVEEATRRMHDLGIKTTVDTMRKAIQQGVLPLAICIQCNQPRFIVFEKKFEQWVEEMAG